MLAGSRSKINIYHSCQIALLRKRSCYYVTASTIRSNQDSWEAFRAQAAHLQRLEELKRHNDSLFGKEAEQERRLEQDSESTTLPPLPVADILEPEQSFIRDVEVDNVVIVPKSELKKKSKVFPNPNLWRKIDRSIQYERIEGPEQPEVAKLAHGLDRVLFNPGVHYLRDPRTQKLNFPESLEYITQPEDFDYETLTPYITSSKDSKLLDMARKHDTRYIGSTSSVSSMLSQLYFLISQSKPVDTSIFSHKFKDMARVFLKGNKFTRGTRAPSSINLIWRDGVYAVDAFKSDADNIQDTILSILGKSMEKVLTLEPSEYERHLKDADTPISEDERNQPETYAYGKIGAFLLRSQLDCQDPRLPRKTFDLKTRAAVPIRLDLGNYKDYLGYSLRRSHGLFESFEREYFDMLRSAFLKYSFQVRIGHMDGIFVAYHNTRKIFGFQYVSREEMDVRLFGSSYMGNESFRNVLVLFQAILDKATEKYPKKSLRISFDSHPTVMNVFVEQLPDLDDDSDEKQLQQNIEESTLAGEEEEVDTEHSTIMRDEEDGDENNHSLDDDEFFQTKNDDTTYEPYQPMTMYFLNTRSFVDGKYVPSDTPVELQKKSDVWKLNYRIRECDGPESTINDIYKRMRIRQQQAFNRPGGLSRSFVNILKSISRRGMKFEKDKHKQLQVD
ncbi:mitochondrial protein Pet127-domain-containing protein [Phascolomyces articulosus]|uniref:Mitochondrial protein Pet127-domain-containing protein n=1 Tax=Phascolomyces articulosus TaxID=60185 RepID=A0AAD5P9W1_9FUNG|nr:mitochondrial protein Pet127-domain-containing protein [Phascolomyces articulosus]